MRQSEDAAYAPAQGHSAAHDFAIFVRPTTGSLWNGQPLLRAPGGGPGPFAGICLGPKPNAVLTTSLAVVCVKHHYDVENVLLSPMCVAACFRIIWFGASDAMRKRLADIGVMQEPLDYRLGRGIVAWNTNAVGVSTAFQDALCEIDEIRMSHCLSRAELVDAVNKQASTFTCGLIPAVLTAADGLTTDLCIASVLFFKKTWKYKFSAAKTMPMLFHNGRGLTVPMMRQQCQVAAWKNDAVTACALPYGDGGQYEAIIVIPETASHMAEATTLAMDAGHKVIRSQWKEQSCDVMLPKFTIDKTMDITQLLKASGGLSKIELDRMIDHQNLVVGANTSVSIKHRVVVRVDEDGTTVAAATSTSFSFGSPETPLKVHADRPFVFVIRASGEGAANTAFADGTVLYAIISAP